MSQMRALRDSGKSLADEYAKVVGDLHRIRIVDIHGLDTYAVENIIRKNDAGIVIYDMIDKIKGFGDAARILNTVFKYFERCFDFSRRLKWMQMNLRIQSPQYIQSQMNWGMNSIFQGARLMAIYSGQ